MAIRAVWICVLLVTFLGVGPLLAQATGPGPRPGPDRDKIEKRGPGDKREGPIRRGPEGRRDAARWFGPGLVGGPEFERMLRLAFSSEEDVRSAMERMPGLVKEGPEAREKMLRRLEGFRRNLREQAMEAAKELGLDIPPQRERDFVQAYWMQRAKVERTLREEMEPRRRQLLEQAERELREQFGPTNSGALASP
ncbi:MAG: hypothetical protein OHK005_08380 [Candidatus Methylacidiphilales bacterium]